MSRSAEPSVRHQLEAAQSELADARTRVAQLQVQLAEQTKQVEKWEARPAAPRNVVIYWWGTFVIGFLLSAVTTLTLLELLR
jgi:hypothetical protein